MHNDDTDINQKILAEIETGMAVIDANGEHIGVVYDIYPGSRAEPPERMAAILAGRPRLDETVKATLLAQGFIFIDASGIEAADRVALPDQIQSVVDQTVLLTVSGGVLPLA